MGSTVRWPSHWTHSRVRPGVWLAQKHTIRRASPTAGSWRVRCPQAGGRVVGDGERLIDGIDALAEHLHDCRKQSASEPEDTSPTGCAQAISDGYAPICLEPRSDHCDGCLMCPGHHVDGCRDARPLHIHRIAREVAAR